MNTAIQQSPTKVYLEWAEPFLLKAIWHNKVLPLESLRPHLYRDEIGDLFLLFGNMEFYLKVGYNPETIGQAVMGVNYFAVSSRLYVSKSGLFSNIFGDSVSQGDAETEIASLECVRRTFQRKLSLSKNSKKLKRMELILGHRIIPLYYKTFHRLIEEAKEPLNKV